MAQAINALFDFFISIGQFLINVIAGLIQLVQIIPAALSFIGNTFTYIPPVIATFALAMITVSVVYLIVGR